MSNPISIVINAAGIGSRMGLNLPKCLLEVNSKTILEWQLSQLEEFENIILVVGYKSKLVIEKVRSISQKVTICFNREYLKTKTGASLVCGAKFASKNLITIDGDTLFKSDDLKTLAIQESSTIVTSNQMSTDAVLAQRHKLHDNLISNLGFSLNSSLEWAGIAKLTRDEALQVGQGHVFEGLIKLLPMNFLVFDTFEVDYPEDLTQASIWIKRNLM